MYISDVKYWRKILWFNCSANPGFGMNQC